ncbi:DMT family transporter [Mycoplasmatota bacterium zrk1]
MKRLGYLSVFATTLIWGFSFVSIKIVLEVFTPVGIVFFRYAIASLFFLFMMIKNKESFKLRKEDIFLLIASSLLGVVFYFYAESKGIDLLNASSASIILSLVPLVIMISNYFIHKERLSKTKTLAILASVLGVIILFVNDLSFTKESFIGYVFMILAVFLWAFYSESSSRLTKKYSELKTTSFQAFIALLIFAPLMLFQDINYSIVTLLHWMNILFLGLISSAIGFFLYVYSIKKIGATETGLFVNFIPAVTFLFGFIILDEQLQVNQILGGLIIIIAMTVSVIDDLKTKEKYSLELS